MHIMTLKHSHLTLNILHFSFSPPVTRRKVQKLFGRVPGNFNYTIDRILLYNMNLYVSHFGKPRVFSDFPVPTPLLHGSTYSTQSSQSCLFLIKKNLASTVQKIGRKMSILLNCLWMKETLAKMPIGLAQYQLHTWLSQKESPLILAKSFSAS